MKYLILVFLLLTSLPFICWAQKDKAESSYSRFKKRAVSDDVSELLQRAESLKDKNAIEALNIVEEALGISIANNNILNEAKCYVLIGEINERIQEWKLAFENYQRAYGILSSQKNRTPELQSILTGLGNSSLKLQLYDEALRYYNLALKEKSGDQERNEMLLNISEVYYQRGAYDEALLTLQQRMVTSKVADPVFESRLQNQLAKIYARKNEPEKTQSLYSNSLNTLRAAPSANAESEKSLQNAKEEISDVLVEQKRYDDEITLRKKSIEYNLEQQNFDEVSKDKVAIGKVLAAKGEKSEAVRALEEAAKIADTLNNPQEQRDAYLALARIYEDHGDFHHALSAYQKYSTAVGKTEQQREAALKERSSLIKKQKDIEELTKNVSIGQREETIAQATVAKQTLIIYGLTGILCIVIITSYFIYKNAQSSKVANQMLALKSLRSQMNPHFIFNALNSVNHFIAQQDERTANKFLSEFSQLMRLVLENSQEDFISLQKEQEILMLYLKLEHYRFRDKFDYEVTIEPTIATESIQVPPMLIQPYVENAVWHGLRYKKERGQLKLSFYTTGNDLIAEISDDGIGRKKSAELKTENQKKHNSTGLKNIQQRLAIINKLYKTNYRVTIEDLSDDHGTRVKIFLPTLKA